MTAGLALSKVGGMARKTSIFLALAMIFAATRAWAGDVLFVSDGTSDQNIPEILEADGHVVTVVTDDYAADTNPTLTALVPGSYDCVVWTAGGGSPAGGSYGDLHNNAALFDL